MHVEEALDRLDQIHDQLARSEGYLGFRVPTVALVGVLGLIAAAVQNLVVRDLMPDIGTGIGFTWYWVAVAGTCGLVGSAAALHAYFAREDEFARRRSRQVMAQFLPCLLAGGAITVGVARHGTEFVPFLPGLWSVAFGLGVIAARPHLPAAIGLVGLGYVTAGAALLLRADPAVDPSGWSVGGVFGVGHLVTALVLRRGLTEESDG